MTSWCSLGTFIIFRAQSTHRRRNSCGFDACEHEYPSMSRHNRKVPTSFYHRFTTDTCAFADTYARGRVVSVLEGGYSDRALSSGSMAHLCGLMGDTVRVDESWWNVENLVKVFNFAIRLSVLPSENYSSSRKPPSPVNPGAPRLGTPFQKHGLRVPQSFCPTLASTGLNNSNRGTGPPRHQ